MGKKILYFINGAIPTEKEREEAEKLGAVFRNARFAEHDFVEQCDEVAGAVPDAYKSKQAKADSGQDNAKDTGAKSTKTVKTNG